MDWLTAAIAAESADAPEPRAPVEYEAKRAVHVDGDYLAYFAAGGDGMPVGTARQVCADRIEAFREMSGSAKAIVHLTLSGSTKGERYLAATVKPYQGQRHKGSRPKNWGALRDYMESADHIRFSRKLWLDREADDGVALASFSSRDPINEVAIATKDKDFRMFAGRHLCWDSYTEVLVPPDAYEVLGEIGPADDREEVVFGHKWFWLQMLQGDTADNIPGVPLLYGVKCGPTRAATALAGTTCNREAYDVVSRAYHAHYGDGWSDRMAEQACLLWMRNDADAAVDNFLQIAPLHKAAARLKRRIATARATLNDYSTPDRLDADAVPAKAHG
jgi:DNA polymerase-1